MVLWELRYRTPRTVDNVQIETFTDKEEEARELGQRYIASLGSPATRFIAVRKIVVASTTQHADLAATYGKAPKPATAASSAPKGSAPKAVAKPKPRPAASSAPAPQGRVGE